MPKRVSFFPFYDPGVVNHTSIQEAIAVNLLAFLKSERSRILQDWRAHPELKRVFFERFSQLPRSTPYYGLLAIYVHALNVESQSVCMTAPHQVQGVCTICTPL